MPECTLSLGCLKSVRMPILEPTRQWLSVISWREICNGLMALLLLLLALGCALASSEAAQEGNPGGAMILAVISLVLAALVGFAVVPGLLRRIRREWVRFPFEITGEGWAFALAIAILAMAALNTGNNLIYLILSAALAVLAASGILSALNLTGLRLKLEFPNVIHAQQPFQATACLKNEKFWLPSCSLSIVSKFSVFPQISGGTAQAVRPQTTYSVFVPARSCIRQEADLCLPRRGRYLQNAAVISSAFPFGFVRRKRFSRETADLIALPELEPPEEFFEILPLLNGSFESYSRGLGTDLYSIRNYQENDNVRFVDWKATAKTQQLKLREFTKQDDRKCCFVFDAAYPGFQESDRRCFEKAVRICANAALHFHDMGIEIRLITRQDSTPFSRSGEGTLQILRILALVEPLPVVTPGVTPWAEDPAFKILFTTLPRGSVPSHIWASSHAVFLRELR
jgi:uncharacterized protein (DUF58 family)